MKAGWASAAAEPLALWAKRLRSVMKSHHQAIRRTWRVNCHHNHVQRRNAPRARRDPQGSSSAEQGKSGIILEHYGAKSFIARKRQTLRASTAASSRCRRRSKRAYQCAKKLFTVEDQIKATEGGMPKGCDAYTRSRWRAHANIDAR